MSKEAMCSDTQVAGARLPVLAPIWRRSGRSSKSVRTVRGSRGTPGYPGGMRGTRGHAQGGPSVGYRAPRHAVEGGYIKSSSPLGVTGGTNRRMRRVRRTSCVTARLAGVVPWDSARAQRGKIEAKDQNFIGDIGRRTLEALPTSKRFIFVTLSVSSEKHVSQRIFTFRMGK